jgi:ssDNA-binding Zn-finger/Zn-ribbon topoisomerase 1
MKKVTIKIEIPSCPVCGSVKLKTEWGLTGNFSSSITCETCDACLKEKNDPSNILTKWQRRSNHELCPLCGRAFGRSVETLVCKNCDFTVPLESWKKRKISEVSE